MAHEDDVVARHNLDKAKRELMEAYDAHFLATGEVLGQRPMTQKKRQFIQK